MSVFHTKGFGVFFPVEGMACLLCFSSNGGKMDPPKTNTPSSASSPLPCRLEGKNVVEVGWHRNLVNAIVVTICVVSCDVIEGNRWCC